MSPGRRILGYDHCVLRPGAQGIIDGVNIDTSHFTGNHRLMLPGGLFVGNRPRRDNGMGRDCSKESPRRGSYNFVEVASCKHLNHLRSHLSRRRRCPACLWPAAKRLAAPRPSACTNSPLSQTAGGSSDTTMLTWQPLGHFGRAGALTWATAGTRRRREPGNDWIVVALGAKGVERLEIDIMRL